MIMSLLIRVFSLSLKQALSCPYLVVFLFLPVGSRMSHTSYLHTQSTLFLICNLAEC